VSKTESIIKSNGDIQITIPKDKVIWQDVLKTGRFERSTSGGWNSKTHWRKRGLDILMNIGSSVLKTWTKNSLNEKSSPEIREDRDFRIEERKDALTKNKRGSAGEPSEGSENNFNWELSKYLWRQSKRWNSFISPYELPLTGTQSDQLHSDIVVFDESKSLIEIIELKQAGNQKDSPLMAFTEGICYTLQLLRNWAGIKGELMKFGHTMESLENINIIIAAPKGYWEHWAKSDKIKTEILEKFNDIATNSILPVIQDTNKSLSLKKIHVTFAKDKSDAFGKSGLEIWPKDNTLPIPTITLL
jgi:hypothetical protein